jgi:hypothetical protein
LFRDLKSRPSYPHSNQKRISIPAYLYIPPIFCVLTEFCGGNKMVTLTVSIPDELKKKEIFERYIKTGELSDEDWMFCERIDWHPVDELPLKEEFVKRLKEARKETPIRFNFVDEFFETIK